MTNSQAAKLVAVLIAAYRSRISPDDVDAMSAAYERQLGDLDYDVADVAVEQLIATLKFLPSIAEVREAYVALLAGEARPGGEAWGIVHRAIHSQGRYRIPGVDFDFGDPVALDVVRSMNWRELCDSQNPVADRARFVELYDKLAAQDRRRKSVESLPATRRFLELDAARSQHRLTAAAATDKAQVLVGPSKHRLLAAVAAGQQPAQALGSLVAIVTDAARRSA